MKIMTLWQPWPWLIARGYKDVENRSVRTHHRGDVLIHVSKRWRVGEVVEVLNYLNDEGLLPVAESPTLSVLEAQCGQVIARATLVDCKPSTGHPSPWAMPGGFAWDLKDARLIVPFETKGSRGLVQASDDVIAQVRRSEKATSR